MTTPPMAEQPSDKRDLNRLMRALQKFQNLDPAMQISTAMILLMVAQNKDQEESLTTQDFKTTLGIASAPAVFRSN